MDLRNLQNKRSIWIGLLAVTAAVLAYLAIIGISREKRINALQEEVNLVRSENAGLTSALGDCRAVRENLPVLSENEEDALRRRGLQEPIRQIRASLRSNPHVIPYQGVQGGEMGFHADKNIHVLNPRWVLAEFEDGHIAGRMLLEYHVAEGGRITWKVVDSYLE